MIRLRLAAALFLVSALLAGCGGPPDAPKGEPPPAPPKTIPPVSPAGDEVAAERAKLSPADLALVEAQEWCVISSDERLGSMGAPLKLDIKGQAVFICCKGCNRKAEADADKALAKVAELKVKAKAEKDAKK